jgi:hypothetical protein
MTGPFVIPIISFGIENYLKSAFQVTYDYERPIVDKLMSGILFISFYVISPLLTSLLAIICFKTKASTKKIVLINVASFLCLLLIATFLTETNLGWINTFESYPLAFLLWQVVMITHIQFLIFSPKSPENTCYDDPL